MAAAKPVKAVNPIVRDYNTNFKKVGPLISVKELKAKYLYGFSLTGPDGTDFPDTTLQLCIDNAVSFLEHWLDVSISPVNSYQEYKDYRGLDYYDWGFLQLENIPVRCVEKMELVYFNDQNNEPTVIQTIPNAWIRVQNHDGLLRLVPSTNIPSSLMIGTNGGFFPELLNSRIIPQAWRVTYSYGFKDGEIPQLMNLAIGYMAAAQALSVLGNLVLGAGIANYSISLDGLSQSVGTTQSAENSAYSSTIDEYKAHVFGATKDDPFSILKILKNYYQGQTLYAL